MPSPSLVSLPFWSERYNLFRSFVLTIVASIHFHYPYYLILTLFRLRLPKVFIFRKIHTSHLLLEQRIRALSKGLHTFSDAPESMPCRILMAEHQVCWNEFNKQFNNWLHVAQTSPRPDGANISPIFLGKLQPPTASLSIICMFYFLMSFLHFSVNAIIANALLIFKYVVYFYFIPDMLF